ncbi:MAG: hypothetical protein ILO36_07055, partial [Abditibacteriota bacterium]|nr:hypothetical protein [Abditibacteriota bacterium]
MRLADVASGRFAGGGFDYLTYYIPEGMDADIGSGVVVSLRGRPVFGYIVGLPDSAGVGCDSLRPILEVVGEGSI